MNHFFTIIKTKRMRMLLWRSIPGYVMQVMINSCVPKLLGITNDSVEVSLWRRNKVGIVHQNCAWKIVPTPDTELYKCSR
eukprot:Gb_33175 [translate_table: standard]